VQNTNCYTHLVLIYLIINYCLFYGVLGCKCSKCIYRNQYNLHSMSLNPHVIFVFFKQCKWSNVAVKLGGHSSHEENSETLSTILLFFSQTQLNPWFQKKILIILSYFIIHIYYLLSKDDFWWSLHCLHVIKLGTKYSSSEQFSGVINVIISLLEKQNFTKLQIVIN